MMVQNIRKLITLPPRKMLQFVADYSGLTDLRKKLDEVGDEISRIHERIKILEEPPEQVFKRSRQRWINVTPDEGLTWGRQINGDAFIQKVTSYNVLHPDSTILEIGPGYGRLLRSMLERKMSFKRYIGVDISVKNIRYLKETFKDSRLSFIMEDFENTTLKDTFDIAVSSLTFKHLYPSFEKMLSVVSKHLVTNAWIFFDLIEGPSRTYFEEDGITFIRHYSREEINEIMSHTDFEIVAYDQVIHDEEHTRLLVVARKTNKRNP